MYDGDAHYSKEILSRFKRVLPYRRGTYIDALKTIATHSNEFGSFFRYKNIDLIFSFKFSLLINFNFEILM